MNGIRCGIIDRKVRCNVAIDDVGPIIDSQSLQSLNEDLVRPYFLLREFYGVKTKREAAAKRGYCDSKDEETNHGLDDTETRFRSRDGCERARQKTGVSGCSQELQAILSFLATATTAMDAETYISLWGKGAGSLPAT